MLPLPRSRSMILCQTYYLFPRILGIVIWRFGRQSCTKSVALTLYLYSSR
jgi:hypothetical protein